MADRKVDERCQQFIRDNWYKLASREIAKQLGISQTLVRVWGNKLKLGRKPKVYKQRPPKQRKAGSGPCIGQQPVDLDFAGMVRFIFDHLTTKRSELLDEIAVRAREIIAGDSAIPEQLC